MSTQAQAAAPVVTEANKQTATVEGLKTPLLEATPDSKVDPLSPKFAALARQQKAIRESQRALEAREAAIKTQLAEVESLRTWKDSLTQNPLKVMQEAGLTYDQLTKIAMEQPDTVLTPEEMRVQKLEKQLADLNAEKEQEKQQSYEQAKKSILNEVKAVVASKPEFEVLKATGQEQEVLDRIETHFKKTGEIMDYEIAANEVQDEFLSDFLAIAKLPSIQAKLKPAPAPITEPEKPQPTQKPQIQTTLSNRMAPAAKTPMSAKDRRERAIAAFMGQTT